MWRGTGDPRAHVAFVLQVYGLIPILSARENVSVALRARGLAPAEADLRAEAGAGPLPHRRPRRPPGRGALRRADAAGRLRARVRGRRPDPARRRADQRARRRQPRPGARRAAPGGAAGRDRRGRHPRPGGGRGLRPPLRPGRGAAGRPRRRGRPVEVVPRGAHAPVTLGEPVAPSSPSGRGRPRPADAPDPAPRPETVEVTRTRRRGRAGRADKDAAFRRPPNERG